MNITSQILSNKKFKITYMFKDKGISVFDHCRYKPTNVKLRVDTFRAEKINPRDKIAFKIDRSHRNLIPSSSVNNDVCFNMICCPKGDFIKGSKDPYCENPEATETIDKMFLLGESEVTQELFEKVMGFNPSEFKGKVDSRKRPVEQVTWYNALDFCNRLSIIFGKEPCYTILVTSIDDQGNNEKKVIFNRKANGFRLPLSKEWESAAKARTNNEWSGTNRVKDLHIFAYYQANSRVNQKLQTHIVMDKEPNEWGFYDMSGNVFEWCWDYRISIHSGERQQEFRGGAFIALPPALKTGLSHFLSPTDCNKALGFRIASNLI